jgi:CubicO group peptidase (beta-lactamase class C family)
VNGHEPLVAPGFGNVADAFLRTIADDGRSGAAMSVWIDGAPVIDLWGGVADVRTGRPFTFDTLSVTWSCTKGIASVLIAMLVERGMMPPYDTPVIKLWPEFGAHGKNQVTIGDALAHRGGLSAPLRDLTLEEAIYPLRMADVLAAQAPLWPPNEHHQYHAVTHGALTAKLVTLATGRSIGRCLDDLVAKPLDADIWLGLPESEEPRVTHMVEMETLSAPPEGDPDTLGWLDRALTLGGAITLDNFNEPRFHQAEFAGVSGIATANGLAKMWSATVAPTNGVRLINEETVDALRETRSKGPGYFPQPPPYQSWGAGVMVPSEWQWYLSPNSFGHDGAGGQVAFADVEAKVGFAYLTNRMGDWDRGKSVIKALSRALG